MSSSFSGLYGAREARSKEEEITPNDGDTVIKVVKVLSNMQPIAYADGKLNVG